MRFLRFILLGLLFASPVLAQNGWKKQPALTTFQGNGQDLCPPNNFGGFGYNFDANCQGVFQDWTSAVYDQSNADGPRLIIFGGGHAGYLGSDMYAWDIHKGQSFRLTNPPQPPSACSSTNADGTPNIAVHDYGGPVVNTWQNRLYVWARLGAQGANPNNACAFFDMWSLDLSAIGESCAPGCNVAAGAWRHETPTGLPSTQSLLASYSRFNPVDGLIYVYEPYSANGQAKLSRFNNTTWTQIATIAGTNGSNFSNMGIDQGQQVAVIIGGSFGGSDGPSNYWVDISAGSSFTVNHPAVDASCTGIANSSNPAMTYDTTRRQLVAYSGFGGTVWVVTVNKGANSITCTSETYGTTTGVDIPEDTNTTGGNPGRMFNKFHYNPTDDEYDLWDNFDKTAWKLKRPPTAWVTNTAGTTATNQPITFSEDFAQGDIASFPQVSIAGSLVTTQADVKQRWPDGSVKTSQVSFVISSLAASTKQIIYFFNQATGNNTGFLTKSGILAPAFNFDMQIQTVSGAGQTNISALGFLSGCASISDTGTDPAAPQSQQCRYWLKGPVVTAVIFEDRSATRSADFKTDNGTGNPLHPYFECYFFPQNSNADCIASVEDQTVSSTQSKSMRDQTYSFTLTGGATGPVTLFTRASFNQIGRSRWMKDYCINGALVGQANSCDKILVDHNMAYQALAKAIPNYDPDLIIPQAQINSMANTWANGNQDFVESNLPQSCDGGNWCVGQYSMAMDEGGSSPWFGILSDWETMYWFSQGDSGMTASILGNSQVVGRLPFHYREADATVSATNLFFDNAGTISPVGRVPSVNARPQENWGIGAQSSQGGNDNCGGSNTLTYTFGSPLTDGLNGGWGGGAGNGGMDGSHWPEIGYTAAKMTGKFWYIEETQMSGAYQIGFDRGCPGGHRGGSLGILWAVQEGRGSAWATRAALWAWKVSVDGSPEQAYFFDKLQNTAVYRQGQEALANSDTSRAAAYNFGIANQDSVAQNIWHIPIGGGYAGQPGFTEAPLDTTAGHLTPAPGLSWSPWEWGYLINVWSNARDMGIPGYDSILNWQSRLWLHMALDSNFGAPYIAGAYRIPEKLVSTGTWWQTATDFTNAYNQGNGSGIAGAWVPVGCAGGNEAACKSQKPCNYSPQDDHWHAAPLAVLGMLYPYAVDGFTGQQAYDVARLGLYAPTGCMPQMFNNTAVVSGASPKWDIIARRAATVQVGSPAVSIAPSPVAFGSAPQGTTSAPLTATVSNTGTTTLTLSTPYFTITGTNSGDFANTGAGTCANGSSVSPGFSCTVTLTYHPTSVAAESAVLNISGNASGSVSLTGSSTVPSVVFRGSGTLSGAATIVVKP